jgi:hypothetical protein
MSLGVHFALADADVDLLRGAEDDDERMEILEEDIEERYLETAEYAAESDKAWDAMHRALADGRLTFEGGAFPLSHAVLGGEQLVSGDVDYTMSLKSPAEVADVAAALDGLTENAFRERYFSIPPDDYGTPLSDEDLAYTWEAVEHVRELFRVAAREGRHVLFAVDA